jgi:hypothetical protein
MGMREGDQVDLLGIDSCRAHIRDGSADLGTDLGPKLDLPKA